MKPTVMVTGGAGYIGSHTVRLLLKQGYRVRVFDNLSAGHEWAVGDAELVRGDLADKNEIKNALKGVDAVVHFAASIEVAESVADPAKYYRNNVANGLNLLEAMIEEGVKCIVFSSSCATYGQPEKVPVTEDEKQWPVSPYGWTKLMFERMLHDMEGAYGIRSASLRYFNAAGASPDGGIGELHEPETHVIPLILRRIRSGGTFTVFGDDYDTPDGSCVRDYIHVDDLAEAHIKAVEYLLAGNPSEQFNLGTGNGTSVKELVESVKRVTGRDIDVKIGDRRPGDPPMLVADNSKARRILGWEPVRTLDDVISSAWAWEDELLRKG